MKANAGSRDSCTKISPLSQPMEVYVYDETDSTFGFLQAPLAGLFLKRSVKKIPGYFQLKIPVAQENQVTLISL